MMFDANEFMSKLHAFVHANRGQPKLVAQAYASAAQRFRGEAEKDLKNRLVLQSMALKLDELSATAVIPNIHHESGEAVMVFADDPRVPTRFDQLITDMEHASFTPDGEPHSELYREAVLDETDRDEGAEDLVASVPPPSPGAQTPASARVGITQFGFSQLVQYQAAGGSGTYTQSGGVAGPVVAQTEAQVVRWDGEENETMSCTLDFSVVQNGANASFPNLTDANGNSLFYRPYAHIIWGSSHGVPHEVYIDVGRGTRVTVAAAFLYANVGMAAPPSGLSGSMVLAGSMGFYATPRGTPVYYTKYVDSLAALATSTIIIPRFANMIAALIVGGANFSIAVQDVQGNTIDTVTNGTTFPYVLVDDAYKIVVTNGGGGAASARVVFGISL